MLKASLMKRDGWRGDTIYEVTEENGAAAGTINETRNTIELDGQSYTIKRKGFLSPEAELRLGDTIVAAAKQKPLFNHYKLAHNGKEWDFKAISLLVNQFGLYEGERQVGTVSLGDLAHRFKDITIDLPPELPREVQVFLLALAIHAWSQQSS
ncbi:MAG TPA: hypothetical protein VG733_07000 [Chthoniobacteraceae bacterium]|nr:hypothetical protein [Chthoniobacteraceae bacterium]